MPQIRPVSDLRNKFTDISKIVHETTEPIFLTKNGYGDMVVMSIEAYEHKLFDSEIYFKLKEAELEAKSTNVRYSHEEVFSDLRTRIADKVDEYKDDIEIHRIVYAKMNLENLIK
ncbi:MAG TPA: type II toxin-antitoxin system prevent-host-death family antitoxin [Clostridia bacterium]|jgi:prevent-host-death family protein|nr:type II toxin-antitoxin system prevent-host-death family antitoxin [Clostridia bacterium]